MPYFQNALKVMDRARRDLKVNSSTNVTVGNQRGPLEARAQLPGFREQWINFGTVLCITEVCRLFQAGIADSTMAPAGMVDNNAVTN